MNDLTRRQNEIYQYLVNYAQSNEISPSIEEICTAMGVKSRGSMHKHIQALVNAGLIHPLNGSKRGIKFVESTDDNSKHTIALPMLGVIAAGQPFEAIESPEMINIPPQLYSGNESYVLTVKGESMIDAGIHDGDWVIIEKTSVAHNNDIIVALIDNLEATLKRFEKTNDLVILHSENSEFKPMIFDPQRVSIQGKLISQMRRY